MVRSNKKIIEHFFIDNEVVIGDELCVIEHLVVSNEIVGIESLAYVVEELPIFVDVDLVLDLHVLIRDVELDALVSNMDSCNKLYTHWLVVIRMHLMFGWLKQIWII